MHILVGFDSVFNKYSKATEWEQIQPAIDFLARKGIDPCMKGKTSGKSSLEAVQLSKRLRYVLLNGSLNRKSIGYRTEVSRK